MSALGEHKVRPYGERQFWKISVGAIRWVALFFGVAQASRRGLRLPQNHHRFGSAPERFLFQVKRVNKIVRGDCH